jgi:predicted HAD superfamily Cof-like phosphohydrolase
MKHEYNPNGTLRSTSRHYDAVKAFTLAMGQPVGLPLNAAWKVMMPADNSEDAMKAILEDGRFDWQLLVDQMELRRELVMEEANEVRTAESVEELTKELADLLYVVYGFAVTFGLPIDEVFERVHRSNMSKLGDDGKPLYRDDGKVLKGPNYQPPELKDLFSE